MAGVATPDGGYRDLGALGPGDFFARDAALTGAARTADVVADTPTTLLQVPAPALRALMANPALSQLVLGKMTERLARTYITDLPRFGGLDQEALKDLRTPRAERRVRQRRQGGWMDLRLCRRRGLRCDSGWADLTHTRQVHSGPSAGPAPRPPSPRGEGGACWMRADCRKWIRPRLKYGSTWNC